MITPYQLDIFITPILALYEIYEQSIINDIARRLSKLTMTTTSAWQMQRLTESGAIYKNALKELAKLTGQSEAELRRLFTEAGVKSVKFDDTVYVKAGLKPLPLNLSPAMGQVLAAGLRKTGDIMRNLTMTTAISSQESFISAADLAYMQVSSGAMSYQQAVKQAVKKVASDGLNISYPTGHKDKLDVATRRAVLTGVSQTVGELTLKRAEEMGQDLVQTSAHIGARPEHQVWQGKVFSISGTSKKYPAFIESTGYGTGPGLMGWNCRHSFFIFFEGISENPYTPEELKKYEDKTVKYNGETISFYDATQIQRGIERKIRYWKRQAGAMESASIDNQDEKRKVKYWQSIMRDFIIQTDLQRQRSREQLIGV